MPGRSFQILRIRGIRLGIQPLWLAIVALITWSLGAGYYPARIEGIEPVLAYLLGLASALLLFASIVAHEFGHALTARRCGVEVEGIDLWLLGGVAKMHGEAHRPQDELRYALAGPAVTLVIALVFWALALFLPDTMPAALLALVDYQAFVNTAILVFNLLPAFPLDGGRVMRAFLWRRGGELTEATATAARLGRGFGWFFVVVGVFNAFAGEAGGLWLVMIGFFVLMAAQAEGRQVALTAAFAGCRAADLMSAPALAIPAGATLAQAAHWFEHYRFTSYPVTDAGRVIGLLTIDLLRSVPPSERAATTAGAVADRDPSLFVRSTDDLTDVLERPGFQRDGRAIVVGPSGAPAGIVSFTDVQRALRARSLSAR
jgi:Zn-dependent protease